MFEKADGFEDFEKFCIERKTALDELKTDEECPGETFCTTNIDGECVRRDVTLETFCGRRLSQCKLYFTKHTSIPYEYEALIEAAIRIKERVLNGLDVDECEFSLYEIYAYTIFSRAGRIVENRAHEKDSDDAENHKPKGEPGRGFRKGDSSAFAWTQEQLAEMDEQRRRRDAKKQKKPVAGRK